MNTLTTFAGVPAVGASADERGQMIQSVLDSAQSAHTRRAYERGLNDFLTWHTETGRPALTKATINSYKANLQAQGKGASVINQTLCAIRKLVREAADNAIIDPAIAQGIANIKGLKSETLPAGRAISDGELGAMLGACDNSLLGIRDAAIIGLLYVCGLRRAELVGLDLADYASEPGQLTVRGKGNKERSAYVRNGAKAALEDWLSVRGDDPGPLFLPIRRGGRRGKARLTEQAVYHLLQARASQVGIEHISPHDFRRTFVSTLLDKGADISTVQKMAGHASVTTTARYDRRGEEAKKSAASLLFVPYRRRTL